MLIIEKTAGIVKEQLSSGRWIQGQRMPSLDALAKMYDVSRSTMWRALGILKSESLISTRRGGAMYAGALGPSLERKISVKPIWITLKERIGRDILAANILQHELPPINKLARQYGAAIDTCRKALTALVKERILRRDGRSFRRNALAVRIKSTMLLISQGTSEKGIQINDPRTGRLVQAFERECSRMGYQAEGEGYAPDDPSALLKFTTHQKDFDHIAGCLINMWMPWNDSRMRAWCDLIRLLLSRKLPVIVIDQDGTIPLPAELFGRGAFRILRIAAFRAGEMVARALIQAKHRRIAYCTSDPDIPWVQNRYQGLRRCFENYGGDGAVVELHRLTGSGDSIDYTLAIADLSEKDLRVMYKDQVSPSDITNLITKLNSNQVSLLRKALFPNVATSSVRHVARSTRDLARKKHDPGIYKTVLDMMVTLASGTVGLQQSTTRFISVLDQSKATAWVCPDDKTALGAVSFLRSRGKRVPEDISVFGFENWREAQEGQLSTYDFNMHGIVQQAMFMIQNEKIFNEIPAISEVDGYVVERRTTRR